MLDKDAARRRRADVTWKVGESVGGYLHLIRISASVDDHLVFLAVDQG